MPSQVLTPSIWKSDGRVVFAADTRDSRNIWQIELSSANFSPTNPPQRLTSGSGREDLPSASAGGGIAYCNLSVNVDVWSVPLRERNGIVGGEARRLTESTSLDIQPAISADGRQLVFASNRAGNFDVWSKDLKTGEERALTLSPAFESKPAISADGSKVAYNDWVSGKPVLKVTALSDQSGPAITACDNDCYLAWDWSPDNTQLLYWPTDRKHIAALELATGRRAAVLTHPEYVVLRASFSPDGRWIAFDAIKEPHGPRLFIAPFLRNSPSTTETWTPVTKEDTVATTPRWSPDGNWLYFVSDRDGYHCLWRQRLAPQTGQPLGQAQEVFHMHGARRSMSSLPPAYREISVARDQVVFPMNERVGNIWMLEMK
jgi:Tol biopolymer transport system component